MNELLKVLFSLSLSGSLLILLLFVCKPLYAGWFSKRWRYYIWLVVVLRLIVPFTPEFSLLGNLIPRMEQAVVQGIPKSMQEDLEFDAGTADSSFLSQSAASDDSAAPAELPNILRFLRDSLWLVWLAAVLVLMVRKITIYRSFVHYVKAGSAEVSDPDILNTLSEVCEQTGVHRQLELSVNALISSPLLIGFLRPCIVLPDIGMEEAELRYIMLHELTHYKRGDMYYKWLVQVVLCLHWFNPLVYWMARELGKACELACDEAVIRELDTDGKKAYGSTLLTALKTPGKYKQSLAAITLHESATQLKERLEAIMKFSGKSKCAAIAAPICSLLLIAGGIMTGAYASSPDWIKKPVPLAATMSSSTTAQSSITVTDSRTATRTSTVTMKPNITSGSIVLNDADKITSLQIRPSLGDLTIKQGEQYKIEVSPKLSNYAIYEVKDGVLRYFDNLGANSNINNVTSEDYNITITVPGGGITYKNLTVESGLGTVNVRDIKATVASITGECGEANISDIQAGSLDFNFGLGGVTIKNCSATGAITYKGGTGGLTLDTLQAKTLSVDNDLGGTDIKNCTISGAVTYKGQTGGCTVVGLKAGSLAINKELGGVSVRLATITNGLNLTINSGGVDISGDIKGDVSVNNKGMGGIGLALTTSKRSDYLITASTANSGGFSSSGFKIDGKKYSYDYKDNNTNAPYRLTVSYANGFGGDLSIQFGKS